MKRLVAEDLTVCPRGASGPPVCRGFSFAIERGEWVAITGENGGGKSTLVLALAGLLPLAGGRIELDGLPLVAGGPARQVAVVLQEPADQLLESTVGAELGFTARNLDLPETEVQKAIELWSSRLDLGALLDRDPRSLSAGEQQRVLLAAALVSNPGLLIADEAGAHLDPHVRNLVLRHLRAEVERGLSVIWVSQEPDEIAAADRVVRIEAPGRPPTDGEMVSPRPVQVERLDPFDPRNELLSPSSPKKERRALLEVTVSPATPQSGARIACRAPLRFELEDASITALVGRNGVGKSVLLSAIAGLEEHPQVRCRRCDGGAPSPDWFPVLVGQYPERQIFADTVAEEVAFAAVSRGRTRGEVLDQAASLFEELELPSKSFLARKTWELSSGEKRLVEIVAGILAPAPLLLLDEPTCGIDARRSQVLSGQIARRATQSPIVLATQNQDWAEALGGVVLSLDLTESNGMPSPSKKTD